MRQTTRLACLATMTILFSGCQQMAWKPGASAADLDRDTAACEAGQPDQPAVHDCLRKRGWVVRVPKPSEEDDDSAAAADAAAADAAAADAAAADAAPAEVATGAGVVPATAVAPATPGPAAAPTATTPEPGTGTAMPARNKSVPQSRPVDPLRRSNVQAWWKMGGQGDALTGDINACVGELGPEHRPDLEKRLYTRGLIDCLKGRGWYGK